MKTARADDVAFFSPAVAVTGRIMFTLIFFLSGITHFTGMAGYVALMPETFGRSGRHLRCRRADRRRAVA
jgi:uncharacterized membrane protein YphA (DoxX/SURF4 family)